MPAPQPSPDADPRQAKVGLVLHRLGVWTFPACVGATVGFYFADRGVGHSSPPPSSTIVPSAAGKSPTTMRSSEPQG